MLTIKAPAKINWFLKVLRRREDGFHDIQSLMQKITLFDEISFSPSKEFVIETGADIPMKENLIYKAAMLLMDSVSLDMGAELHLKKSIPVGAGLGGGSSDAAAALIGLNKLWELGLSIDQLCKIAEQIGSDVPFFLRGPVSYAQGRGEKLSACNAEKTHNILLVKPLFGVSTAWAYKTFAENRALHEEDEQNIHTPELTKKALKVNNIRHFIRLFEKAELNGLNGFVLNDLESIVIKNFPEIAEIKDKLTGHGARFSLMSGSGSTVFGVFNTRRDAEKAAGHFMEYWTSVVETSID
jgi:4-diphosphocytidyl-2-C-methyl-D-erythritol kinase